MRKPHLRGVKINPPTSDQPQPRHHPLPEPLPYFNKLKELVAKQRPARTLRVLSASRHPPTLRSRVTACVTVLSLTAFHGWDSFSLSVLWMFWGGCGRGLRHRVSTVTPPCHPPPPPPLNMGAFGAPFRHFFFTRASGTLKKGVREGLQN